MLQVLLDDKGLVPHLDDKGLVPQLDDKGLVPQLGRRSGKPFVLPPLDCLPVCCVRSALHAIAVSWNDASTDAPWLRNRLSRSS